jgi:rhamnulokinase
MANEYTNATTGAIVNTKTRDIDFELLEKLGIRTDIFAKLSTPATKLGGLSEEIKAYVGFDTTVILAATHDTASAVAACSVGDGGMYISSGTWSLIGTEITSPVLSADAMNAGFTNEGGVEYRYRFLKNFMGMWLFQNIRKNLDKKYTYDEMMNMAMNTPCKGYIDPNAPEFVAPENMIEAIKAHLGMPELTVEEVLSSVYHSLARSYSEAVKSIERISGREITLINIIGGGSKDAYLNRLTGEYTGKKVIAGPVEATAIGNLKVQMKI